MTNTDQLWESVKVLDDAAEYLKTDAGKRDVYWTTELDEAVKLIEHKANKLRSRAVRAQ